MTRLTKRQLLVPLVVLTVVLAGCSGGGGGDGGATATATTTDGGGGAMTDTATTASGGGGDGGDGSDGGDGDGGDGDGTDGGDGDGGATTSGGTDATTTSDSSDGGDGEPSFSSEAHTQAVKQAGSYSVEFTIEGLMGGSSGGSGPSVIKGTEKVNLETNALYSSLSSESEGQSFQIEYYSPANTDTTYQYVGGQVREIPASQALTFNFTEVGTGATANEFPDMTASGTGQTALGPANKYVVNSIDQLPEATRDQYDSVKDFEFVVFVDKDTGVIAKYDYRMTFVQDGEESSVRMTFEITNLGSTTVEPPEWAP